jgi:hypothetical protein
MIYNILRIAAASGGKNDDFHDFTANRFTMISNSLIKSNRG